jgi:hypothetical protein
MFNGKLPKFTSNITDATIKIKMPLITVLEYDMHFNIFIEALGSANNTIALDTIKLINCEHSLLPKIPD